MVVAMNGNIPPKAGPDLLVRARASKRTHRYRTEENQACLKDSNTATPK